MKVRMLTGTYLLDTHRKKLSMDGASDATCPLCCLEDEDIVHMPTLSEFRSPHLDNVKRCLRMIWVHMHGQILLETLVHWISS